MKSVITNIVQRIHKSQERVFLFFFTLLLYGGLWIINPSNKGILVFISLSSILLFWKMRNWKTSLFLLYVITSIINTGKRYDFIIIPPGIFSLDFYPLGYFTSIIMSPSIIIAFFIAVIFILQGVKGTIKDFRLLVPDIFLIYGIIWRLLSDFIVSPIRDTGFILWLFSVPTLFVYLYVRFVLKNKNLYLLCFSIFSALLSIEAILAIMQFINGSPLNLSIEIEKNMGLFGEAADEYSYRFRPVGTFDHANTLGIYIALYMPILLYIKNFHPFIQNSVLIILNILAFGLTLSRSAWIGLSSALIFQWSLVLNTMKHIFSSLHIITKILACIILFVFSIYILFPRIISSIFSFSETGGATTRTIQIAVALQLIKQSPIFGVGTAMSVSRGLEIDTSGLLKYFPSPVHNRFMLIAVENGIPAVILLLSFYFASCMILYKASHRSQTNKKLWNIYVGAIVCVVCIGFFQPIYMDKYIFLLFAIIYGYYSNS